MPFVEGRFVKTDGIRERPMEEWDCLLVFTPAKPDLHILNTTSWAIMELCEGQDFTQLVADYQEFSGGRVDRDAARNHVRRVVRNLETKGIVTRLAAEPTATEQLSAAAG
ncbi:PqqD family protein [Kitasatospora sp. GP82]|uniref:PqqD family protein n=1 Tax=Kitasatospora sp. GP82 TaxID=3035089 RepID=UPI0024771839|nr:PqqD family protein [Kitasatospora sp. GP82]MDH6126856.1 hypothetical protein [Kitasatospora sp. GP82]